MLTHDKDYYLAACYPVAFVIGAVGICHWATLAAGRAALLGWAVAAVAFSAWISPLVLPIVLPIVPVPALKAYIESFPLKLQPQEKSFQGTLLPQVFADQLGWRDFASQVGGAWTQIPAAERARSSIKVDNYGEAAALDVFGQRYGLPPALSGHNQYFLWGLRGQHPSNLLVVQDHPERLAPYCKETKVHGTTNSPNAMRYENGKVIVYCRRLKVDLEKSWPQLKSYN